MLLALQVFCQYNIPNIDIPTIPNIYNVPGIPNFNPSYIPTGLNDTIALQYQAAGYGYFNGVWTSVAGSAPTETKTISRFTALPKESTINDSYTSSNVYNVPEVALLVICGLWTAS